MHRWAGRESTFDLVSFFPTDEEARLPSIRILILRLEGLLRQLHLLFKREIEKLQRQTKNFGMLEGQWRVDQVCKACCSKYIVELGAESHSIRLR